MDKTRPQLRFIIIIIIVVPEAKKTNRNEREGREAEAEEAKHPELPLSLSRYMYPNSPSSLATHTQTTLLFCQLHTPSSPHLATNIPTPLPLASPDPAFASQTALTSPLSPSPPSPHSLSFAKCFVQIHPKFPAGSSWFLLSQSSPRMPTMSKISPGTYVRYG